MIATADLRAERATLVTKARAVLDKAQNEHRSLDDNDNCVYKHLMDKIEAKTAAIADAESRNRLEMIEYAQKQPASEEFKGRDGGATEDRRGSAMTDRDGNEVRMLAPRDSVRSSLGLEGRRTGDIGRLAIGMASGNWRGAEHLRAFLAEGGDTGGGVNLNPELSSELIDLVRNRSAIVNAGAKTAVMSTSQLRFVKLDSDPTAYWCAEGHPITESQPTFGALTLTANTLAALVPISIELVEDAPNAAAAVESAIASALAVELDRACLRGDGAGAEPLGWLNTTGIVSNASSGFGFDEILTLIGDLWDQNAQPTHAIYSSTIAEKIAKLKDGDGQYLSPSLTPEAWQSLTKTMSNQTASTELYIGDLTQAVVAMRTSIKLEAFRGGYTTSNNAMTQKLVFFRAYMRADFGLLRPASFGVLTGIA